MGWRVGLFVGMEVMVLPLMIWGAYVHGHLFGWFFPWLFLTAMVGFLLGTYDRIHLTRNRKGRVRLRKSWTLCFFARPPVEVDVHEYAGVAYGPRHEVGMLEWFLFIMLLACGVIPGLVWWYMVFHRDNYFLALAREYNFPDVMLYQGGNLGLVQDMAQAIASAAHMPVNKG